MPFWRGRICLGALVMGKILMNQSIIFQASRGKSLGFVSEDLTLTCYTALDKPPNLSRLIFLKMEIKKSAWLSSWKAGGIM